MLLADCAPSCLFACLLCARGLRARVCVVSESCDSSVLVGWGRVGMHCGRCRVCFRVVVCVGSCTWVAPWGVCAGGDESEEDPLLTVGMLEMPPGLAGPPQGKGVRVFNPVAHEVPRKQAHLDILRRQNQAAAGRVLQSVVCVCVSCVLSSLCFCLTVLLVCFLACCV